MLLNKVLLVNPNDLQENPAAKGLYAIPENYEIIKQSISEKGILEPIIVRGKQVVSGNLRLRIAKELGLEWVPVIEGENPDDDPELEVVVHNQQRIKTYSEMLREYEILEKKYPIKKGSRTDLNPELKAIKEQRDSLCPTKEKIKILKAIKGAAIKLYAEDSEDYRKLWDRIDTKEVKLHTIKRFLQDKIDKKENDEKLPSHFEVLTNACKIYNKSAGDMEEIPDESIACIICSPPYFQMRDYSLGREQLGLEENIDDYIKNLVGCFKGCKRVLKTDGSMWVNLSEPAVNGSYHCIPHRFVLEMLKLGWRLNAEFVWIKANPPFTGAKKPVRAHEYVFHFVKSETYYYDISWLKMVDDQDNLLSYGTNAKVASLLSSLDLRDNIIRTKSNNMDDLRKECKRNGFNLTHSAAFPLALPFFFAKISSRIGDTILDLFSGTGTTGEAALSISRNYIGYELNAHYIAASKVRIDRVIQPDEDQIKVAA